MLVLLIALRTKKARPAEIFTDSVTGMFVNYPLGSSFRTDVLLAKVREMYCLFQLQI